MRLFWEMKLNHVKFSLAENERGPGVWYTEDNKYQENIERNLQFSFCLLYAFVFRSFSVSAE